MEVQKLDLAFIGLIVVVVGIIGILLLALFAVGGYYVFFAKAPVVPETGTSDVPVANNGVEADDSSDASETDDTPELEPEPEPEPEPEFDCTAPVGDDGDTRCEGAKVYKCTDNAWIVDDTCHSALACLNNECTEKKCSNPDGWVGEYLCAGSGATATAKFLYACTNDNWDEVETCSSSTACNAAEGQCD